MPFLTETSEIDHYRELLGDIWNSATVTVSITELKNCSIPNGEIVFHRENLSETEESIEYQEGSFRIVRKTFSESFKLLEELVNGNLVIDGVEIDFDVRLAGSNGNSSNFFQKGINESKVFEDRSVFELNSLFWLEINDEVQDEYKETLDSIGEELKTASEPYYKVSDCEIAYFSNYFSKMKDKKPKLLLFADTHIRCDIDESNRLKAKFPKELKEEIGISIYPREPHGEYKSWKVIPQEEDLEEDDLCKMIKPLELDGLETLSYSLFVEDEWMNLHRHVNEDIEVVNKRVKVLENLDQRNYLVDYLEGGDPDQFEVAVLNLMSIAGYRPQWFGDTQFKIPNNSTEVEELPYDEIDIIAHSPDNTEFLFIECTNKGLSAKSDLVERMDRITSDWETERKSVWNNGFATVQEDSFRAVIATPMSKTEASDTVIENLKSRGIDVLFEEDLKSILLKSAGNSSYIDIETSRNNTVDVI